MLTKLTFCRSDWAEAVWGKNWVSNQPLCSHRPVTWAPSDNSTYPSALSSLFSSFLFWAPLRMTMAASAPRDDLFSGPTIADYYPCNKVVQYIVKPIIWRHPFLQALSQMLCALLHCFADIIIGPFSSTSWLWSHTYWNVKVTITRLPMALHSITSIMAY